MYMTDNVACTRITLKTFHLGKLRHMCTLNDLCPDLHIFPGQAPNYFISVTYKVYLKYNVWLIESSTKNI